MQFISDVILAILSPNIHVRCGMSQKSRMQFEDRKLSETVGNCRYGRNKYKETRKGAPFYF